MKKEKEVFRHNLVKVLIDSLGYDSDDIEKLSFIIEPKEEPDKNYSTKDEYIRLVLLNDKNISGREFNFSEAIELLSWFSPYFPLWVKIYLNKGSKIVKLEVSLRFRTLNVITKTQETEYPPFRICT